MSAYTVRPLSDRTWVRPDSQRVQTRFTAKWRDTEKMLLAEVNHLDGRNLVLEVDVREQDLRIDGTLRANAREASTPAVRIAFDSRHGPQLHRCDTFYAAYAYQGPDWQHNVRAIALTLELLRAMDRYGAVDTGQQYQGFKAIGGGTPLPAAPEQMSPETAAEILRGYGAIGAPIASAYKAALRATHPDAGGNRADFDRIQQAARVLDLAR